MKKANKKGFTIVELVIVIAVVAILAAVLVPTFVSVVKKANESKDTQLVRNLNTALAVDTEVGKHETMQSALEAAAKAGYDVAKINASATDNEILWDSKNDCFVYKKDSGIEYIPNSKTEEATDGDFWKIVADASAAAANKNYNSYVMGTAELGDMTVANGLDVGENTVKGTITFKSTETKTVTIRTNGGTLVVNAPKATVKHYGKADKITITAVAPHSYHEYGEVLGNIELANGRVVMETGSKAAAIKVNADAAKITDGTAVVSVDTTASAVSVVVPVDVKTAIEGKEGNGITASTDKIVTDSTVIENMDKFAGGLGTEESPYLIATAEQFKNISDFAVSMVDTPYAFSLISDVNLNEVSFGRNYVGYVFNGNLNGNNHKIIAGNELSYIFYSTIGETLYKNIEICLNNKLVRVTKCQAITSEEERTVLTYDNVDVSSIDGIKYDIGKDNSAYYADGTFCSAILLARQNDSIVVKSDSVWTKNQYVKIENCDVNIDLTMTGTRAAVFCGGQVYSMYIAIKNCTYSGNFYGANPGLVFANQNCCTGEGLIGSIEVSNVKLLGKLICLNLEKPHGLTFANNSQEFDGVEGKNNIVECAVDDKMDITLNEDSEYVITVATDDTVDSYVIQLGLGKLFWYDINGNVTSIEASNYTLSIRVAASNVNSTEVYKVVSLSIKQAKEKGIETDSLGWRMTENGERYAFANVGNSKVLVVDVSGDFADETKVNVANIIGYVGDMPKYYKDKK